MTPYLVWDEDNRAEIDSVEELDRLVDRLTAEALEAVPFTVTLQVDDDTSMFIVVGRDESHMEFYSTACDPHLWSCRGPWDDDEHIEFLYRGHDSGIPKRYCVPIADARKALRQFFRTGGQRPENVEWEVA